MAATVEQLQNIAQRLRLSILETIVTAGKGHIGGAYSCLDMLVSLYYDNILAHDPKNPRRADRDRFILSKGHVGIGLFAVLADLGYFPVEELAKFNTGGALLLEHPDRRVPGVEIDSGSLGHGLGISAGIALAAKMNRSSFGTVVMLGDGECYEGSIWEAAIFASHHRLDNLTAIVDRNNLCVNGSTETINQLEPFTDKWRAFGWDVVTIDGHDFTEIRTVLQSFRANPCGKPRCIMANTIKGKGVSFMENKAAWHHGVPKTEHLVLARRELGATTL